MLERIIFLEKSSQEYHDGFQRKLSKQNCSSEIFHDGDPYHKEISPLICYRMNGLVPIW